MTQPPEQPQQPQQWWQPPGAPEAQPGQWHPAAQPGAWQQPNPQQQNAQQNPWSPGTPAQYPNTGGQPYAQPQQHPSGAQPQPYANPGTGPYQQGYANPAGGPQQQGYPASGPQQQPYGGQQVPGVPPQQQGATFGGGFQPATYGGLGAFSAEAVKKAPRSRKPWVIGGAAVAVVIIGGGAAWLLGAFRGDTLEQKSLQDGVSKVLAESYGEPDVKNVACPSGESTQNGTTFDCTLQLGGQPRKVTVRVLNDKPEYEVGAPH
ncbi:DUF4333 domain-containing protein [Amycolatopsis rhabdoformis]|uniref:DUF4333 domain-containing protein n=1 Tax=Amycolatopsis rhabdoformis TaxID=1448059 RepID=A0ABZ1I420_9PSEU|nr:DUF4333 domain-containing protein [Amycolatopsis rhabdoformis]WSE29159.1 DUF4333 domain-containing protein [Amycolatopsis rhabdoformis]